MEPKKVIGVFFILALLAIAVGIGAIWYQSQQPPEGRYDFTVVEQTDSYETQSSVMPVVHASYQKVFYKTQITLVNDRFDAGLNTKSIEWKMKVDGYSVNQNDFVFRNVEFKDVVVKKGETVQYIVMFEIPENILGLNIEIGYVYASLSDNPKLSHDDSLNPSNIQISAVQTTRYVA